MQEDQIKNSMAQLLKAKMGSASSGGQAADKTEKYRAIPGIDEYDLKLLLRIDKDIDRLFEIQMRKRNKNDEMVRNKINELNANVDLRDFLFKQQSI